MKVKVTKAVLLEAIRKVQDGAPGKASLPILQNALVEAKDGKVSLTTTDLDQTIKASANCEIVEEGKTTIPIKILANVCSKCIDGDITISTDAKEKAKITAGRASFSIAGLSPSEFPTLPSEEGGFTYTVSQSVLKEMIKKVSFATSKDDTRRVLTGVLFSFGNGKLTMVATDGRRLAMDEAEIPGITDEAAQDIVLPSKAIAVLAKNLSSEGECTMKKVKTQLMLDIGTLQLYTKLSDDQYPNYRQVIPKEAKYEISIDRQMLIDSLDRCSIFSATDSASVTMTFEEGRIVVHSTAADIGEATDEVPIKYDGAEKIEARFNPYYLMDPLKVINDDEVKFNLNDGHTPLSIKCSEQFLSVLMPLRIA